MKDERLDLAFFSRVRDDALFQITAAFDLVPKTKSPNANEARLRAAGEQAWVAAVTITQQASRVFGLHLERDEHGKPCPPRRIRALHKVVASMERRAGVPVGAWKEGLETAFQLHVHHYEGWVYSDRSAVLLAMAKVRAFVLVLDAQVHPRRVKRQ